MILRIKPFLVTAMVAEELGWESASMPTVTIDVTKRPVPIPFSYRRNLALFANPSADDVYSYKQCFLIPKCGEYPAILVRRVL